MVFVHSNHYSDDSCSSPPTVHVEATEPEENCSQHAQEARIDVYSMRFLHEAFTKRPNFHVLGLQNGCIFGRTPSGR